MSSNTWAKWIFMLIGAQAYMDWVLITNYSSKNAVIRWLWKSHPGMVSINKRLRYAVFAGHLHLLLAFIVFVVPVGTLGWWLNLMANTYPVLVQLYVGYRCLSVKAGRLKNKLRLNAPPASYNT